MKQVHIQNQSQNIFYYINKLPIDLINEIKKYIPNKKLIFVNREKYIADHLQSSRTASYFLDILVRAKKF